MMNRDIEDLGDSVWISVCEYVYVSMYDEQGYRRPRRQRVDQRDVFRVVVSALYGFIQFTHSVLFSVQTP